MSELIGPCLLLGILGGLSFFFWRNASKHDRIEADRRKQQTEERNRREADYHARHQKAPSPVPAPLPIVATPRKATPGKQRTGAIRRSNLPAVRAVAPTPAPTPTPSPSDDSLSNAIAGIGIGCVLAEMLHDDRPASCTNDSPFTSGGGGDFGGGGASSSWDSDTPSINSDDN